MATNLYFSKHSCLAFLCSAKKCPQVPYTVFPPPEGEILGRGTEISGRAPLLWTKLPPMLSQCLGSSLLSAERRRTEKRECWKMPKTTQHQGMLQSWKAEAVYYSK